MYQNSRQANFPKAGAPNDGRPQPGTMNGQQNAAHANGQPNRPNPGSYPANTMSQQAVSEVNKILIDYLSRKGYHKMEAMLRAESSRTLTPKDVNSPNSPAHRDFVLLENLNKLKAKPVTNVVSSVPAKRSADGEPINMETVDVEKHFTDAKYSRSFNLLKMWVHTKNLQFRQESWERCFLYPLFVRTFVAITDEKAAKVFYLKSKELLAKYDNDFQILDALYEKKFQKAEENIKDIYFFSITFDEKLFYSLLPFLIDNHMIGGDIILHLLENYTNIFLVATENENDLAWKKEPFENLNETSNLKEDVENELDNEKTTDVISSQSVTNDANVTDKVQDEEINVKDNAESEESEHDKKKEDDDQSSKEETHAALKENDIPLDEQTLSTDTQPGEKPLSTLATDNKPIKLTTVLEKFKGCYSTLKSKKIQPALPSVQMFTFHNTNKKLLSLEFSNDYKTAATGFQDSYIKIWSLDGKDLVDPEIPKSPFDRINETLIGHSGAVYALDYSPCSNFLLSGSEDSSAILWSLKDYKPMVKYVSHEKPVWDVKFSPIGNNSFVTGSNDQTARVWSCDRVYPLRIFAGHLSDVDCVTFHPNGQYIFSGSSDRTCRMWDINTGNSVRLFSSHTSTVTATTVTPDGRWLLTGSEDGIITMWDIGTGKRLKSMRGHGKDPIYSLCVDSNGTLLTSSGADNSVRVWDIGKNTHEQLGGPDDAFSNYMANDLTSSINQDIKDYSRRKTVIATNDLLSSFHTRRTPVFSLKFMEGLSLVAGGASVPE